MAMAVSNLQNDGLKWERTSSWNVGFDFAFFNSRLSGSVDVYQKKTKDNAEGVTPAAFATFGLRCAAVAYTRRHAPPLSPTA